MKKNLVTRIIVLTVLITGLTAFLVPQDQAKKDYPVEKFSKLSIAIKSKVYIEQGSDYKLDIQTRDENLENIKVEFNSGELQIGCIKGKKVTDPITIFITVPELSRISVAGSAEVNAEKTFKSEDLDLTIAGSGFIVMKDLQAVKLSSDIAGSGKIELSGGKAGSNAKFIIAGSGNINAGGYEAAKVKVDIAGSGSCKVFAKEELDVQIAGSGKVAYKGNPKISKDLAGSGKVVAENAD